MGRPLRIPLPRPTRRGSARAFLILFFLSSILAWVLVYFIPASPWNRWYPPAWHPAVYNPPPSLNRKWWRLFSEGRRWGTGPTPPHPSSRVQPPSSPFYSSDRLDCSYLPGASDVLLVMKTTSTETHAKIPNHLKTTFRCSPSFDIYSDVDEMIKGYTVHNAIDDIPSSRMISFPEFDLYNEQLDAKRRGRKDVSGLSHAKHLHTEDEQLLAQKLDRWKVLPMIEKALIAKPAAKWFVFIEDDTAVLWSNLLLWIAQLRPQKPLYFGSQVTAGELDYALGGAGWMLSNSAVRSIVEAVRHDPATFDQITVDTCCGDRVVARALQEIDIPVSNSWPTLQNEPPYLMQFGAQHWCHPIVTFHHMNPADVRDMWSWEQEWMASEDSKQRGPILQRDIFWAFVAPGLSGTRNSWDNLSADRVVSQGSGGDSGTKLSDDESASLRSAAGCSRLCSLDDDCLQWRHRRGECSLSHSVRLGKPQARQDGSKQASTTSGWMQDRIEALVEKLEPCDEVRWFTDSGSPNDST